MNAKSEGLLVPPVLILSITNQCNLSCTGCYAASAGTIPKGNIIRTPELNYKQWHKIIKDAEELGVQMFVIAGGEPFLFPGLLDLCAEFKNSFFVIVTNGTIISDEHFKHLKKLGNIAVIVSLEGSEETTDLRRGKGIYKRVTNTLSRLHQTGVLNGISVTITRMNFKYWMNDKIIEDFLDQGIRIGVFLEYIPTTSGNCSISTVFTAGKQSWDSDNDNELILTPEERDLFRKKMLLYREKMPFYLIHSPGDEEYFGGCVSAGRGFAHVTPSGDLTPCPVSDIATHNLSESKLRDSLASPLFSLIRKNEHLLQTEGIPCALFAHPKEVDTLAKSVGAYRVNRVDIEKP
jgi:MoaA/NifB/PqqE/SkfB family radical SAM enzyme